MVKGGKEKVSINNKLTQDGPQLKWIEGPLGGAAYAFVKWKFSQLLSD